MAVSKGPAFSGRQIGADLNQIRPDHTNRYFFASTVIRDSVIPNVLDVACGVGYGAKIMTDVGAVVLAIDISSEAIEYANEWYIGPEYMVADAYDKPWGDRTFDHITCFEFIEHLEEPRPLLKSLAASLKNGYLFVSTPNQMLYPFKAENYQNDSFPHKKHYRPTELDSLLKECGFNVLNRYCQTAKKAELEIGTNGIFLTYIASTRLQDG